MDCAESVGSLQPKNRKTGEKPVLSRNCKQERNPKYHWETGKVDPSTACEPGDLLSVDTLVTEDNGGNHAKEKVLPLLCFLSAFPSVFSKSGFFFVKNQLTTKPFIRRQK